MLEWGLLGVTIVAFVFIMKKGYQFLTKHA